MFGRQSQSQSLGRTGRTGRRRFAVAGAISLVGVVAVGLLSVSGLGATPLTGSGTNVVWAVGTAGSATGSGAFSCGTTANVTMASGFANSGLGFAEAWSTVTATNEVFADGITPSGALAIHSSTSGIATSVAFSYEITNPILLVNYIDPGQSINVDGTTITVLDWYSAVSGATPLVTGNAITLDGNGTENEGWAIQVAGTYGPTSGPLTFTFSSTTENTSGFSVAVPTGTDCAPVTTTTTAPEPVPARFTG